MKGKDLLSIGDLTPDDVQRIIKNAVKMKQKRTISSVLDGKTLALVFEKPSLRTKVSFDVAMHQLGGHSVYLSQAEVGLGVREPIADAARTLSRYVDIIAARTFAHATVEALAKYASVPVINALSDGEHPCQAMADIMTIYEKKGKLKGLTVAYVGDGNNVATSLFLACVLVGTNFRIASPKGYELSNKVVSLGRRYASHSGAQVQLLKQPEEAVKGADVVYTDVWTSMGQEVEAMKRRKAFAGYQVDTRLMKLAKREAIFMHDMPAHHGEEVAPGMIDSPRSVVFDQAENKMHILKVVLTEILGK